MKIDLNVSSSTLPLYSLRISLHSIAEKELRIDYVCSSVG